MKTPTTLIIMDGFALGEDIPGNAVRAAATPQLDYLFSQYPFCQLEASGLDVGLPDGQMGNSEVGHTNIGAGRVVFQDLPRISKSIQDGTFFENPAYIHAMDACREHDSALHLMGLLSDGGVHSHLDHLFALMHMAGTGAWKRSISTPSWTAGTCPPPPVPTLWPERWKSAGNWASARSPR